MKTYGTISEAYLGTLADVLDNPDYVCAPRGLPIREKLDYQFRVTNPEAVSIVTHDQERNVIIANYTAKELELYNSCSNRVEDYARASKFWNKIVNPDGKTINSAYGSLIWHDKSCGNTVFEAIVEPGKPLTEYSHTPWEWVVGSLLRDKDTRQAVLRFSRPDHMWFGNKDQVCTMHANFLIRNDKLHMSTVMRSNDLMLGLVYDASFFVSLIDELRLELLDKYPLLQKGEWTHMVHSMHLYERDIPAILKMLGR